MIIATFGNVEWAELADQRAIPSAYATGPSQVIFRHQLKGTVCTSRNACAEIARGDWLCFLDADDELDPGFVGSMRRAFEQHRHLWEGPVLLTPAVSHTHAARRRVAVFRPEKPLSDSNWLVIGTLIQRDFFWAIGGFDERDPHGLEDYGLFARAAKAGATVVKVPEAVYIAHTRRLSSHAEFFRRDRAHYMSEYHRIRRSIYPELYADTN